MHALTSRMVVNVHLMIVNIHLIVLNVHLFAQGFVTCACVLSNSLTILAKMT